MEVDPEPDSNIDPVDDNDTSASAESLELRQRAQQQRRRQGDAAEGPQQAQVSLKATCLALSFPLRLASQASPSLSRRVSVLLLNMFP